MNGQGSEYKKELLDEIIEKFYERNLSDPLLKHFFEGRNVDQIKRMNQCMLMSALSSTENQVQVDIKQVHSSLGIELVHFERFIRNMFCVLRNLKIDEDDIEFILTLVDYFRLELLE